MSRCPGNCHFVRPGYAESVHVPMRCDPCEGNAVACPWPNERCKRRAVACHGTASRAGGKSPWSASIHGPPGLAPRKGLASVEPVHPRGLAMLPWPFRKLGLGYSSWPGIAFGCRDGWQPGMVSSLGSVSPPGTVAPPGNVVTTWRAQKRSTVCGTNADERDSPTRPLEGRPGVELAPQTMTSWHGNC